MAKKESFALYPDDKGRFWGPRLSGHKQRNQHRRTKDELLTIDRRTEVIRQEIIANQPSDAQSIDKSSGKSE